MSSSSAGCSSRRATAKRTSIVIHSFVLRSLTTWLIRRPRFVVEDRRLNAVCFSCRRIQCLRSRKCRVLRFWRHQRRHRQWLGEIISQQWRWECEVWPKVYCHRCRFKDTGVVAVHRAREKAYTGSKFACAQKAGWFTCSQQEVAYQLTEFLEASPGRKPSNATPCDSPLTTKTTVPGLT